MRRLSLLILLVFAVEISIYAQQYFIKSYSTENGLPTNIITGVCQDKQGHMWFSTYMGISRYDGFSFTNFTIENGLKSKGYRKILCDEKGVVWAIPNGYSESVVFFENEKWNSLPSGNKKKSNYLASFGVLYKNDKPIVCIGGYSGVEIWKDNEWHQYDISPLEASNRVFNINTHNNTFYISSAIGICTLADGKLDWSLNQQFNPTKEAVFAINFDRANPKAEQKIWILWKRNFGYVQNKKYTELANGLSLEDVDLVNLPYLAQNSQGNMIFGNNFSKYYYDIKQNKYIPIKVKNGFSSNGATSVFADKEDNFWITDSRGIDKISNMFLINYTITSGLPENEVTAIAETNDGRLVFGHNNEISIFDRNQFKVIKFSKTINAFTRVLDIAKSRSGGVWFTANDIGVGKLEQNNTITWCKIPEDSKATAVFEDTLGKTWIGTNKGLLTIENGIALPYKHSKVIGTGIRKIFAFGKGVLLTGMRGLWYADTDTAYCLTYNETNRENNTFSYLKVSDKLELCGTMNGLFQLKNGTLSLFAIQNSTIKTPVYFIKKGLYSEIWIGTNNGVYRWDINKGIQNFTVKNGLAGRETNRSAGFLDSKGNFWVGTDRGLSCFLLSDFTYQKQPPKVKLLNLETIEGKVLPLNQSIDLSYFSNSFTLHFRGISFISEELISYQYKLEGYDKDWKDATQSMLDKIKYSNIPAGKYTLKVKARNHSSNWSQEVSSASIQIRKPYYQTWWFITIATIIVFILLWIMHSITRQKLINSTLKTEIKSKEIAEEELQKSKQQLSFVLEGSRLGTWDWNIQQETINRNAMWSEMLGYTPNEIKSSPHYWKSLIHPDDIDKVENEINSHLKGETTNYEVQYRLLTKDGTYKWVLDRATVTERDSNNNPLRMSGTLSDIDKSKRSEEALHQSEERIRLVFDSLPIAIYISPFNSNIDVTLINGDLQKLFGYTQQEFLSSSDFWRTRLHPDDYERIMAEYKNIGNKTGLTLEYRWQISDGSYKWFHDQSILRINDSGKEFLGVLVDINDRKLYEEEIKKINSELHNTNAEKDKLFSIISHDLRSPVNGFTGLTNLLLEELNNLEKSQIHDILISLQNSASKVNDLVNDLLEWSRLQRGQIEYNAEQINLNQITAECLAMYYQVAKSKKIELKNLIPDNYTVIGDRYMLKTVLRNLISNAIKFTHQLGDVIIEAEFKNQQITISVADTGIGMSNELISKLFKVNEKTGRKGTEGEPSSGLGLLLCKEFIEKHKGHIWIESTEQKGSTFKFSLEGKVDSYS